jgi:hypothetical protein
MSVVRERPGNIFVGYGPETPPGDRMVIELAQVSDARACMLCSDGNVKAYAHGPRTPRGAASYLKQ